MLCETLYTIDGENTHPTDPRPADVDSEAGRLPASKRPRRQSCSLVTHNDSSHTHTPHSPGENTYYLDTRPADVHSEAGQLPGGKRPRRQCPALLARLSDNVHPTLLHTINTDERDLGGFVG